ncbi:pimeloyl-ACP methyl ester carboxylesterase [Chitinophaga niastensis]|uniref:Pimeloyl-ACP methyl ester carboxylesterase n=1 Tax=Chitinophaga niastensis TaxID=536980 RepID=A0A2P8HMB1_CHINA|nr:epoxide hydrolase family protein [Chitinophaga niastensis]PSL47340.1 pimeloyl-ACP methyl ester carboxylesterase [Chitinophaga niastensis]
MKPFKIEIAQDVLNDLKTRLTLTRWTDEPENAGWNYGTNPTYLRELVDYWQNKYDWRKQEEMLNSFPQFKADIDGITIHFIYVKGKGANAKPLILTHEWPDSFYRFYKVIPMLTDPASHGGDANQSFDVIIPSIPGFGFSGQVAVSSVKTAELWAKLMTVVLGYKTFFAAGASFTTKTLALQYPDTVKAIHLTDVGYPNGMEDWSKMSPAEQEFGQAIQRWFFTEGAFNMIQSTKPQTLGYGLNDSPVGLASWLLEKFNAWSDNKGNIENSFSKDELLTYIMIYWVSQTINTSIRTYLEDARAAYSHGGPQPEKRVEVPTGVAVFPGDADFPIEWAERKVNVQQFTKMPKGGRFAAMEEPALWANDIRTFFWEKA